MFGRHRRCVQVPSPVDDDFGIRWIGLSKLRQLLVFKHVLVRLFVVVQWDEYLLAIGHGDCSNRDRRRLLLPQHGPELDGKLSAVLN